MGLYAAGLFAEGFCEVKKIFNEKIQNSQFLLGIRIHEVHALKEIPLRESKSMRRRHIFSFLDCGQCTRDSAFLAHGNRFPGQ